ncbi:Actin-binding Rho-activating protein [Halotydeus destructor]|nr:Actin-binding Rho-activating protein [Halotydeus destructor]KAI1308235.1 Actin-binding Rho-activating protein [Halotydeus destructor]
MAEVRVYGGLSERMAAFKEAAAVDHRMADKVVSNDFADNWTSETKTKSGKHSDDPNYGRPVPGSKTEQRGIKAHKHMLEEVKNLCAVIRQCGLETPQGWLINFGELFRIYAAISDKVVGVLLRARKQKLLDFEGEMLFQRRDDHVIITLFRSKPADKEG